MPDHRPRTAALIARPAAPLRITIVEPRGRGGMIHYAYQLATALADQGNTVSLLTARDYELADLEHRFRLEPRLRMWRSFTTEHAPAAGPGPLRRRLLRPARRAMRAGAYLREWMRIVRHLVRERPDVAQFGSLFGFETVFLIPLRRRGIALGQICHEPQAGRNRGGHDPITGRLLAAVRGRLFAAFDAVFVHGPADRRVLLEHSPIAPDRVHLIEHGNEELLARALARAGAEAPPGPRRRFGIPERAPVVLFFGNVDPSKGLPDLMAAIARLAREQPDVRLVIAGHPSKHIDPAGLAGAAADLDIAGRVHLDLRYVPLVEVPAIFGDADVVCLPYLTASASGVLQAAYAFGRPVVATRVGSLPDVVAEGETGLLAEPADPDDLARALAQVLADPDRRRAMGERARELARTRYSWEAVAAEVAAVYRRARAGGAGRG